MKLSLGQARLLQATGVGLLFMFLALRDVDFAEVRDTLAQTNYALVLVAFTTVIATTLAKTARWQILFYPRNSRLRYRKLLSIVFIGQMVSFILPGRFGELARIYLVGEIEGESKVRALGTVAVEKTANLATLCLSFLVLLPGVAIPRWLEQVGIVSALMTLLAMAIFVVLAAKRDRLYLLLIRAAKRLPDWGQTRIARYSRLALSGLDALQHRAALWRLCGWSVLVWLLSVATNYVAFLAIGLPLPFTAAVFLLLVLQLGVAIPSVPGRTPMFYLSILALSVFSVDKDQAFSYAVLLYVLVYAPSLLLGLFFLLWENVDLHRLRTEPARYEIAQSTLPKVL